MMFVSIVMAMVCLSIPIVRSSVQLPGAGICWNHFTSCVLKNVNSTDPEMDPNSLSFNATEYLCCPLMQKTFDTDLSCFCTASTYLHSTEGAAVARSLSSICNIYVSLDTLDATCAGGAPAESPTSPALITPSSANQPEDEDTVECWDTIGNCIKKIGNESSTNPKFDENSPSFDMSKYLCCPLIQQTADTDKPCFCNAKTNLHQDSVTGDAVTKILIQCNVIESIASLDLICPGNQTITKGGSLTGVTNGMVLPESLSRYSAIFVVLAYFFY